MTLTNPGIFSTYLCEATVEEFLLHNDKELYEYYLNADLAERARFEFLYSTCSRFCLRNSQATFVLRGIKEKAADALEKMKKQKAKEEKETV